MQAMKTQKVIKDIMQSVFKRMIGGSSMSKVDKVIFSFFILLIFAYLGLILVSIQSKWMEIQEAQIHTQIVLALLTASILAIYYRQAELLSNQEQLMSKQTKLFELEKMPMLVFTKHNKPAVNEIGKNATNDDGIIPAKMFYSFETFNASSYPVKVEYVEYLPMSKNFKDEVNEQIRYFKHKFKEGRGVYIYPESTFIIPDNSEKPLKIPGILKIKASNVYFPELVLRYAYDISLGEIVEIEGLP